MITTYDIQNWYWRVGADAARVYSSAATGYVPVTDAAHVAWLAGGARVPTYAVDEAALAQVFADGYPAGWPGLRPTTMTPLEFMARFTDAELGALATAAQGNASMLIIMLSMSAASEIDLSSARTIASMAALVAAGLLTDARKTAILTP